ncbi:MAG: hypothetical protein QW369_05520 [Desulfurococcaceae archaeon]
MAVRVRIRVKSRESPSYIEASALVNSGFETEKPQLLIPLALARQLNLWPPPLDSYIVELGTAGGPVRNYLVPDALEVHLVAGDKIRGPVVCDAILSHIEEEVIINDKLGEELGIVIIGLGSGKWRLMDEPQTIVRYSEKPQYFR